MKLAQCDVRVPQSKDPLIRIGVSAVAAQFANTASILPDFSSRFIMTLACPIGPCLAASAGVRATYWRSGSVR